MTKGDMECFVLGKYILVNKLASQYFEQEKHLEASRTRAVQIPKNEDQQRKKQYYLKGEVPILSQKPPVVALLYLYYNR